MESSSPNAYRRFTHVMLPYTHTNAHHRTQRVQTTTTTSDGARCGCASPSTSSRANARSRSALTFALHHHHHHHLCRWTVLLCFRSPSFNRAMAFLQQCPVEFLTCNSSQLVFVYLAFVFFFFFFFLMSGRTSCCTSRTYCRFFPTLR